MRKKSLLWMAGVMLIALLVTNACLPKPSRTDTPEAGGGQATSGENQVEQPAEITEQAPQPPAGQVPVPEDVPIMQGGYNLQTARGGASIIYQVDGDVKTVVDYYTEKLPEMGWDMAGPPDTAVGSIASMLRENEASDRMTINMQENKIGGFVQLTIFVVRSQ